MGKVSNRDKILCEGLKVVHKSGFQGASVRDIVQAAGVPQGSFTNHFSSKEAFGLEVLNLYFQSSQDVISASLRNDALPALQRLRAYFASTKDNISQNGMKNGCLLGNFGAETGDCSEQIRCRVKDIFAETQKSFTYCLKAGVDAGDLPKTLDPEETAGFVVSGLQGAILLAKTERSLAPLERFEHLLFSKILR